MEEAGREAIDITLAMSMTRLPRGGSGDGIDQYTSELMGRVQVARKVPVVMGVPAGSSYEGLPVERLPGVYRTMLSSWLLGGVGGNDRWQTEADLYHATDHRIPRLKSMPVVATVHDAIPLSHPQWVGGRARRLKAALWRRSAHWAEHIITDSEFSKGEITRWFGLPEERISVVSLGVDARYFERLSDDSKRKAVANIELPEHFFLFIGTIQPRKNLDRIIAAHAALPYELKGKFPLLVVGGAGWGCEAMIKNLSNAKPGASVRWLGQVDDLTKRALLQSATALVFPSLLEGFGLPVLEGFASRTPVITSNTSSLPEVAGDAAWLVDPTNVSEIAKAMEGLARDESVRRDYAARGLARAREFTWDACARKTECVYARVLGRD